MRIKKITPTDQYRHINFSELKDDWKGREVYTPTGFQPILAFDFIKHGPTIRVKTDYGDLVCDPHHRVIVNNGEETAEKFAVDLLSSDTLVGYNNEKIQCVTEKGPTADLYDIQLPEPHLWYTSGIVSHNSILLCNNAISSLKGSGLNGAHGQDVLLITYELDVFKTAMRCMASMANVPLNQITGHKEMVKRVAKSLQETYHKRFYIYEWPPDECSVDHIYALLANLKRTEGWKPDVIIIDYMDLMVSRVKKYNDKEYDRQKHVATEIRGLAKNENVLVFTATQTNRGGMDSELVDLNKTAESFGKQFALDYVVSLNQSIDERNQDPAQLRFFIAKNRNGPKHQTITCEINYNTMTVRESQYQRLNIEPVTKVSTEVTTEWQP